MPTPERNEENEGVCYKALPFVNAFMKLMKMFQACHIVTYYLNHLRKKIMIRKLFQLSDVVSCQSVNKPFVSPFIYEVQGVA